MIDLLKAVLIVVCLYLVYYRGYKDCIVDVCTGKIKPLSIVVLDNKK